ncbi:MAG: hypothetical protein U1G07_21620 [Verrucomicrobiota bacterium]
MTKEQQSLQVISAFQHFSFAAFQLCSFSALQHFSFAAFQLCSISAFQLFSISANTAARVARMLIRYLRHLSGGRLILWCYFLWYLVVLVRYFDPNPRLWLTSLGLSLIIGFALYVSTTAAGTKKVELERWQTIRLFLMPFCVSSFAALVKGQGFILVFSPHPSETVVALGLCAGLCVWVWTLKRGDGAN